MKKLRSGVLVVIFMLSFVAIAQAGLDDFIRRVNAEAKEDINRFATKLGSQFGLPVPRIDDIMKKVPSPADAFMVLQLGHMSNKPPDTVLPVYHANRDRGWGAIAKELGIKPGSREFHALKSGNLSFTGQPGSGIQSYEKGKKKKGKGRDRD